TPTPTLRLTLKRHRRVGVGVGGVVVPFWGTSEGAPDPSAGRVASPRPSDDGPSAGHFRSGPPERNNHTPESRRPGSPSADHNQTADGDGAGFVGGLARVRVEGGEGQLVP